MQEAPPRQQTALPRRIRPHNPPGWLLLTPPLPLSLHFFVSSYTQLPLTTLRPFTTSFLTLTLCWLSYPATNLNSSNLAEKVSSHPSHLLFSLISPSCHSFIFPKVLSQSLSANFIGSRVRRRGAKSTAGSVIRVITPACCVCLPDGFLDHRV